MEKWKKHLSYLPKHLYIFSWLLLFLAFLQLVFSVTNGILRFEMFFNSDAIYLPQIYKAFFIDRIGFSTWNFPAAPFFFPDFLIYSLIRVITKNFVISNIVSTIVIFSLLILTFIKLFFYLDKSENHTLKSLLVTLTAIYVILLSHGTLFISTVLFLSPVWHAGELLVACTLVILLFETLNKERNSIYPLVFLLTTLTVFSDKSLIKDLVFPLFVSLFFTSLTNFGFIKKLYKYFASLAIGTIFGSFLYKVIMPTPKITKEAVPWILNNWYGLKKVFYNLITEKTLSINVGTIDWYFNNHLRAYFPLIIFSILIASCYVFFNIYKSVESKGSYKINTKLFILGTTVFTQFVFGIIATLLFGWFRGTTHLRYISTIFIFPVFWLSYFLLISFKDFLSKYLSIFVLFLFSIYFGLSYYTFQLAKPGLFGNFLKYRPPNSECIDNIVKQSGLRNGLGGFWNSATNTLFSKEKALVQPAATNLKYIEPFHCLSSSEEYLNKDYNFILLETLDEQVILEELGEPDEITQCPTTKVYIYKSKEDSDKINQRFKARLFFQLLEDYENSYTIKAEDFPKFITRPYELVNDKIDYEISENSYLKPKSNMGSGYFVEGPIVYLKGGVYKVELTYSSESNNIGYFDLIGTETKKIGRTIFENTNGRFISHNVVIEIGIETGEYIGFFPFYGGEGNLLLDRMTITKVN